METASFLIGLVCAMLSAAFGVWTYRLARRAGPPYFRSGSEPPSRTMWAGLPFLFFLASQLLLASPLALVNGHIAMFFVAVVLGLGVAWFIRREVRKLMAAAHASVT